MIKKITLLQIELGPPVGRRTVAHNVAACCYWFYDVTVKKVDNKTVHYKETAGCRRLIFWPRSSGVGWGGSWGAAPCYKPEKSQRFQSTSFRCKFLLTWSLHKIVRSFNVFFFLLCCVKYVHTPSQFLT